MMRINSQSPNAFYFWPYALLLLFIFSSSLLANQETDENWTRAAEVSISDINKQLESFDIKHDKARLLVEIEKRLSEYKNRAQKCVDEKAPQAEKLKADIEDIGGESNAGINTPARKSLSVLNELASKTETQLKVCQAILLNVQNLEDNAQALKSSILTDYLLSRGGNILATFQHNFESISPALISLRDFIVTRVQITSFENHDWLIFLAAILGAWSAGVFLGKKLRRLAGQITSDGITGNLIAASYACLSQSLPLLLASAAAIAVLASLLPLTPMPALLAFFTSFTIYLLTILSARVLLHPCAPAKYFFVLNADFAYSLYKRLQFLLILGLLAMFGLTTNVKEIMTQAQWELARASFITLTTVNLIWLISYLNRAPGLLGNTLLRSLVSITLIVAIGAEFVGYRNLASYLYKGTIGSIMLGIALWLMYSLLHDILDSLNEGRHRWGQTLRDKLQLKKNQAIPGLFWIRILSVFIVWMFFIISMLQLWRFSDSGWPWFLQFINDGFEFGNIRISPLQIALGLMLFAILLTFVRWFRQDTLPKWVNTTNLDHGGREALIAVSGYVGVLLSALIGLTVAGFDFTNLAIVAGALSVGIGFGLQNIVNNFVSGLILLFERPIRTGDWIVVGSTEGYVRRISIRSTQIETFDRADVIVPNSELISSQVTNWMLSDPWGRVVVPVGVAYGSDVRKVEQLLVDCATQHPLVIKDDDRVNPPSVLFRGFGDSSLNFELRAFISKVDKRLQTLSDLNFAIEQALRENDVEIPFPQRDLHLRSMDPSITFTSRKPE